MKFKKSKKIITLILISVLVLSFSGCDKKEKQENITNNNSHEVIVDIVEENELGITDKQDVSVPSTNTTTEEKNEIKPIETEEPIIIEKEEPSHTHSWVSPTCTKAEYCSTCGATGAAALNHLYSEATCYNEATCVRCGAKTGEKAEHNWTKATCTEPKMCKICGEVSGSAKGHKGGEATCEHRAVCERCGEKYGKHAEHQLTEATCTKPSECTVCHETFGQVKEHDWTDATCKTVSECKVCGEQGTELRLCDFTVWETVTEYSCETDEVNRRECTVCGKEEKAVKKAIGHQWVDANCESPKHCTECELTEGEALGHTGGTATCEEQAICETCEKPYGEVLGHNWIGADCTSPRKCETCQKEDGESLGHRGGIISCTENTICEDCGEIYILKPGHTWVGATCQTLKTCSVCGETEGEFASHVYAPANCQQDSYCKECGYVVENSKTECNYSEWTTIQSLSCENDLILERECKTCQNKETKTETKAEGHKWTDATCETAKICSVCQKTDGEPLGHTGGQATETKKAVCDICGEEYGELLEIKEEVMFTVYDLKTQSVVTDTRENILAQIVMNEMAGAFHEEALKAQAVTAHSWLLYEYAQGIEAPEVALKAPNQQCIDAVAAVGEKYVSYNGSVAFTPYFACSNGKTQSSAETWGGVRPYLTSVESKYDVDAPSYKKVVEIDKEIVEYKIKEYIPDAELKDGDEENWIKIIDKTSGNYNNLCSIGGITKYTSKLTGKEITVKGSTVRAILDLASPDFKISYNETTKVFKITTYGWGHGCGMSQWGAHYYAINDGFTYDQILMHYFPNTTIVNM